MKITTQLRWTVAGLALFAIGSAAFSAIKAETGAQDGSVVNKSGIVRGASQRLVKLETNAAPNDELMTKIDGIIAGLINGDQELKLPRATDPNYLEKIQKVEADWTALKATILQYRKDPSTKAKLIKDSEDFFAVTNDAVFAAEEFSSAHIDGVQATQWILLALNLSLLGFILVTIQRAAQLLKSSASSVAGSSAQIATTVEEQGRIVADQTSSVNETTTTVEELGASSMQAAQQAGASAESARTALSLSEEGNKAVSMTVDGIENLKEKVAAIAEQIMQLSEQTDQISMVSNLVADVADQTNMLALNAAVEAARAGEQGKGFAVVAGEIRKLADQSRSSANKINTLVGDIQASINKTVMVTDEGNKTAIAGIEVARNTSEVFESIAKSINEVFLTSQEIALSAKQQAVGVQQAVSAMNAINMGAKETATAVIQVKASTEELTDVAKKLEVTI